MILLANRQMNRLYFEITGHELQNAESLWELITASNSTIYQLEKGETWSFSRKLLNIDKKERIQMTAINITELATLSTKLSESNSRFTRMNSRLRLYSSNLALIKTREERLAIKMQIHKELGHVLLATRKALSEKHVAGEEEIVLSLWEQYIAVLLSGSSLLEKNEFEELRESAADIGITLKLTGYIPENRIVREIVIMATIEALNNAARYGSATESDLIISETESELYIEIVNNGRFPKTTIKEGGGLTSIRESVEKRGGFMAIETDNKFKLMLKLPKPKIEGIEVMSGYDQSFDS
jgi:hypothetical protein